MKQKYIIKAIFLFGIISLIGHCNVYAQCIYTIPPNAVFERFVLTPNTVDWLCSHDTVGAYGGNDTVFAEKNSYVNVYGGSTVVFAKRGVTVNILAGSVIVYYDSNVTINSIGGSTVKHFCSPIIFNYTYAPVSGSCLTLGVKNISLNAVVTNIYPNPSNGIFTVDIHGLPEKGRMEVYNILAQQVLSTNEDFGKVFKINLENNSSGIYFYRLVSESGNLIRQGKLEIQK